MATFGVTCYAAIDNQYMFTTQWTTHASICWMTLLPLKHRLAITSPEASCLRLGYVWLLRLPGTLAECFGRHVTV